MECGMCESLFESLESLETHLDTCEIYECNHCYFTSQNESKMKDHVVKEHGSNGKLLHMKMAGEKFDEVYVKTYTSNDI